MSPRKDGRRKPWLWPRTAKARVLVVAAAVVIANRTLSRAEEVARLAAAAGEGPRVAIDFLEAISTARKPTARRSPV